MLKILIADDEKMPRDILVNYINWDSLGVDLVVEADDGLNALKLALDVKPDIIISDIKMPRMNGIEFATSIRSHLPECKFIFLSGYSDKEYLKSAIKLKAVSYVEKPIDLEEITSLLKETIAECINEKIKRKEESSLLETKLCLDLAVPIHSSEEINSKITFLGKDFSEKNSFLTAIIKFNSQDNKEHKLEILKDSLAHLKKSYLIGPKGDDYSILHFAVSRETPISIVMDALEVYLTTAKQVLSHDCKIFISLGKEVLSMNNLHTSYQSAVIAMQKHFFRGNNSLIVYQEDTTTPYEFDEAILSAFEDYIKSNKRTEADVLIKRLVISIKKHETTHSSAVRNIFYKLILGLSRIAEDRNVPFLKNQSNHILHVITTADTLDEIEKNVLVLIAYIFEYISTSSDSGKDILAKITGFIAANYCSDSLSVNYIAENLYLTPTYLCMVFKRDTGKTINQYITTLRVDKAKEFLTSKDIKLYDIARRVGYNDGKYFTKVFTKTVGINPKEYREIHCHEKKNF